MAQPERAMKTEWKTLPLRGRYIKVDTGKVTLIELPHNSDYDGWSFWHPTKLVHKYEGKIVYNDTFVFKLIKKDKDRFERNVIADRKQISANELVKAFANMDEDSEPITPLIHTPPRLEPLENVEPLEELLDD